MTTPPSLALDDRLAPFPELAEADHAFRDDRIRRGRQERIRIERRRQDLARLSSQAAELRTRRRRAALAQLQARSPAIFRLGLANTPLEPAVRARLAELAGSEFVQTLSRLIGDADGTGTLTSTLLNAAIASALAVAARRLGVIDKVNVPLMAKAVNQVLASELPVPIKVLATAMVTAAASGKGPAK